MTDSSEGKVKDDGGQHAVINGPEKLEIDDSMPTTTAVIAETGRGTPRHRYLPCRCNRFIAAIVGLALLSAIFAALLVTAVVRLRQRPTSCSTDDDSGTGTLTDGPSRVLSDLANDGSPLPWTDIRLPRNVIPESYALQLRVDPSREKFHGAVDIDVTVKHDTRMIVLHASLIDVGGIDNVHITSKVISDDVMLTTVTQLLSFLSPNCDDIVIDYYFCLFVFIFLYSR